MKTSVVFRYINEKGEECLSIGSYSYFKKQLHTAKQLIEMVGIRQTDEQWYMLTELSQNELYDALCGFMEKNTLYVERPN